MQEVVAYIKKRFTAPLGVAAATPAGSPAAGRYAALAEEFLQLLLMCRSPDYAVGETVVAESPLLRELHAAVAAVASPAAAALVKHIRDHIAASVHKGSGELARIFIPGSAAPDARHLLLAAQCLYLVTRHFQVDPSLVKEALEAVGDLLRVVRQDSMWRGMAVEAFRHARGSDAVAALLWLLIFSVSHATAPWRKKRSSSGDIEPNRLLQTNLASVFQGFFNKCAEECSAGGQSAATAWAAPVISGFLSILTLIQGCALRGRNDDTGYDKALESFVGAREGKPRIQGKAAKRMVQLAPAPHLLSMPVELVYMGPYEVLSFLFDEMLPLLRHVSELELAALKNHLDQLQVYEDFSDTSLQNPQQQDWMGDGLLNLPNGSSNPGAALKPFTSEMAHVLEALKVCLQELPPKYLDPDLDVDCAATWFIFHNCVKHLSQALKIARGTASSFKWGSYAYKLVSRFIDVLTMIGRHPQYIERIAEVLETAQSECPEIQWSSLVQQALACVGFYLNAPSESGDAPAAPDQQRRATAVPLMHALHPQFTEAYAHKTQRMFVTSFFLLLRQLLSHPSLRHVVKGHLTLPMALSFLFAPLQSPSTLGSALSLVSALISSTAEAVTVWEFLESHQLLGGADARLAPPGADAAPGAPQDLGRSLSLLGHCRYECSQGVFRITVGFLHLVVALFRFDAPEGTRAALYGAVTHFIAQEIFCGITRRAFKDPRERFTVMALAAAALRQALLVRFSGTMTNAASVIPFPTVMATGIAPADVVGEIHTVMERLLSSPAEILSSERAAVRQCLHLLHTAVHAMEEQRLRLFSFDARTTQDSSLASKLLVLAASPDLLLARASLHVLMLFSTDMLAEAARFWHADDSRVAIATKAFSALLHPQTGVPATADVEPELALLDALLFGGVLPEPGAVLVDVKGLMLDFLTTHAAATETSVSAWMCGLHSPVARAGPVRGDTAPPPSSPLLASVVLGATSPSVDEKLPNLAVKYVKLIYVLRSSRLYGPQKMRAYVEAHCQPLFLSLLHLQPTTCDPLLLSKYAYIVKLLSTELCHVFQRNPEKLSMRFAAVPSVPVEIALSLLHPHRRAEAAPGRNRLGGTSRDAAPDAAQWLCDVLRHLPVFPVCPQLPHGNDAYLVKATDQVVQYDIRAVLAARREELEAAGLPPLSTAAAMEQLAPYVEANKCFLIYAASDNFLHSLCQLLSLACCTVEGIAAERLRELASAVLASLDATPALTLSAQERVAFRLCSTLATIIAKLKLLSTEPAQVVDVGDGRAEAVAVVKRATGKAFSTVAGNTSNFLHHLRRSPATNAALATAAAPQCPHGVLLRPVVEALVRWGGKIPCIRLDLYNSLMLLSVAPGVSLDDLVVFRVQEGLLQLLVGEICEPCSAAARYTALTLLIQLVRSSETVCSTFCCAVAAPDDGLGPIAIKCFNALFAAVDLATYQATVSPTCDLASIKRLVHCTFDLLRALSVRHTPQMLQGCVLLRCIRMDIWTRSSQIVLAHAVDTAGPQGGLHRGQEVVRLLFLMAMRWMNVMLAADGVSRPLLEQVQSFFAARRPLIDFFLQAGRGDAAGAAILTDIHVEISGLLRALSASHLVEDCRCLAAELAIPHLLLAVVQGPLSQMTSSGTEETQADAAATVLHHLSDFLMRCEYGRRGELDPEADADAAQRANPLSAKTMLRHRPNDVDRLLEVIECLSRCVGQGGGAVPQRRLECLVFALHALVALLQSLVLPLCSPSCESCGADFSTYLQTVDCGRLHAALTAAQDAAYQIPEFNSDCSNGLVGRRTAGGWDVAPQSALSNTMLRQRATALAQQPVPPLSEPQTPNIPLIDPSSTPRPASPAGGPHGHPLHGAPPVETPVEPAAPGSKRRLDEFLGPAGGRTAASVLHAGFHPGGAPWTDVLSVDHSLRLLKIIIANAVRAVKVAAALRDSN
eukprot:gene7236-5084_t